MNKKWEYRTYGIPDDMFLRETVPMTKSEIRSITLNKLQIKIDDCLLDIGCGTGSISVEMALAASQGRVYSIEINPKALQLTRLNAEKFNITNMEILKGRASELIMSLPLINGVVIGGSKGEMDKIFAGLDYILVSGGRVVINVITIENLYQALQLLKQRGYKNIDVTLVAISKGEMLKDLTMMKSQNPVYIITAEKN